MSIRPLCLYNGKMKLLSSGDSLENTLLLSGLSGSGRIAFGKSTGNYNQIAPGANNQILASDPGYEIGVKLADTPTLSPGFIFPFGGIYPPTGFLNCDGSSYSVSSYPSLYSVIGGIYGRSITDICTGGQPISGGDGFEGAKQGAFDNNMATYWASLQSGTGISGVAYIGYDFISTKHIRHIYLYGAGSIDNNVTSVIVQNSSSPTSGWVSVGTFDVPTTCGVSNPLYIYLPPSQAMRYWRLLANSNVPSHHDNWRVYEIEMAENLSSFSVPNYNGRVGIGAGTGSGLTTRILGETGGEETHVVSLAELPSHQHTTPVSFVIGPTTFGVISPVYPYIGLFSSQSPMSTVAYGGSQAHNNMQPYIVMKYIIKT